MDDAIRKDEVELAVDEIQLVKASEFIKYGGTEMVKCLLMLFQKIWDLQILPQEWKNKIPIHNKCKQVNVDTLGLCVYPQYTKYTLGF